MAQIRRRGYLRAGVNAGLLDFGYCNPATGHIEGFEIDLVRELTRAIFGDASPAHYRLVALTVPQRIPFVQDGQGRRRRRRGHDHLRSPQGGRLLDRLLRRPTSACWCRRAPRTPASTLAGRKAGLRQRRVDPDRGHAAHFRAARDTVGAPQAIDCLVWLQEGRIDAISTDDSILLGFTTQDPNTKIVGGSLADVPYGMAIKPGASGLRPLRQRRPGQAARRRYLAPAVRPVAQPPRLEPDPPRPALRGLR